jgi:hypothetical protein
MYGNQGAVDAREQIVSIALPKEINAQFSGESVLGSITTATETVAAISLSSVPADGMARFIPFSVTVPGNTTSLQFELRAFLNQLLDLPPASAADFENSLGCHFLEVCTVECSNLYLQQLQKHDLARSVFDGYAGASAAYVSEWGKIGTAAGTALSLGVLVPQLTGEFMTLAGLPLGASMQSAIMRGLVSAAIGTLQTAFIDMLRGDANSRALFNTARDNLTQASVNVNNVFVLINQVSDVAARQKFLQFWGNVAIKFNAVVAAVRAIELELDQLSALKLSRDSSRDDFVVAATNFCEARDALERCSTTLGRTACDAPPKPPPPTSPADDRKTWHVNIVSSWDPNQKLGPRGVSEARYVGADRALEYLVSFENSETASARAREINITDQLDITTLDLPTFSLGPIHFGSHDVTPPPGLSSYTAIVDLRPETDLLVDVDAHLDMTTGLARWRLTSIDPTTGGPPDDPLVGFLPPNKNPPEGSGGVLFTVMQKKTVVTETALENRAAIVFDANEPIVTQTWVNAVDRDAPVSKVDPLPGKFFVPRFVVRWSGTDVGAGVQMFDVFVSDNGGGFFPWLTRTAETQATFEGKNNHSYRFYSIAHDLVGNTEPVKSVGDTTTTIRIDTAPPVTSAEFLQSPKANGWNNSDVTILLASVDDADGSGVKEMSVTLSGAETGTYLVARDRKSVTVTSEGTTFVTYFARDEVGNREVEKVVVVKIDKTRPVVGATRFPTAAASGWNNSPVTVTFQCVDELSGLDVGSPPSPTTVSNEGAEQSVTGRCVDRAGNAASATIDNVNIDLSGPTISVLAAYPSLWPPNGKRRLDTISGSIGDGLSGTDSGTATFTVIDEYGHIQPTGALALSSDGRYSFTVMLEASRHGEDLDGRRYEIIIRASDKAGNYTSSRTEVVVPHDQRE